MGLLVEKEHKPSIYIKTGRPRSRKRQNTKVERLIQRLGSGWDLSFGAAPERASGRVILGATVPGARWREPDPAAA
jgi:hypothetical protein